MQKTAVVLAIIGLIAGCSSAPVKEQPKAVAEPARTVQTPPPKANPNVSTQPIEKPRIVADPLNDPNSPLAKRSIYYEFDKSDIKDEYKSLIRAHAGYLSTHRDTKVRVEGNCDERGSREYNLALGQRRADSVKSAMKLLGVADNQVETVSWGEEKPKAQGHDESAWAQNRRSDIVYDKAH